MVETSGSTSSPLSTPSPSFAELALLPLAATASVLGGGVAAAAARVVGAREGAAFPVAEAVVLTATDAREVVVLLAAGTTELEVAATRELDRVAIAGLAEAALDVDEGLLSAVTPAFLIPDAGVGTAAACSRAAFLSLRAASLSLVPVVASSLSSLIIVRLAKMPNSGSHSK